MAVQSWSAARLRGDGLKITIVLGPFQPLPPGGFGAVEKIWVELARAFAVRGHDVCVIGRGGSGRDDYVDAPGLRIIETPGSNATGRLILDLFKDLLYALRITSAIPRSDIVVTNTFWLPVVLTPLKHLKGKVVVHVARYPKGQMWLYRGADAIQAISGSVARAITQQCPALKRKVTVLGYPIDTAIYCPPAQGRRMSAEPVILYVGRIHPEKGVHLLVEAFRRVVDRIPSALLRIVGPAAKRHGGGGNEYTRLLREAAAGLSVEFVEPIFDDAVLSDVYREADCFCYPSLAEKGEAFGRAVLEAMATGLPCVVSNLQCFSDILTHELDGIVFDHSAQAPELRLAESLIQVLADTGLSSRLGKNAAARAKEFELEKIATRYLDLFAAVAAN